MALFSSQKTKKSDQDFSRLLEADRLVSKQQFREHLQRAKREERHVAEVLFESEHIPADRLLEILGQHYDLKTVRLRDRVISSYILNMLPKEVAVQHNVVVFKKVKDVIHVATTNPDNDDVIEFIKQKTGLQPIVFLTTPDDLQQAIKRYTGELATEFARIIEESTQQALATHDSEEKLAQFVPVITMVETIIDRAIGARASDIHLEPRQDLLLIRFRVDGLLQNIVTVPTGVAPAIIARLKLLAGMKIDEHRLPQDGRFSYTYRDYPVAVRVSAVPTLHGTKMVLRLLDQREQRHSLTTLGLNPRDLTTLKSAMSSPQGMILVTGPTGSGKTTTLYSVLGMLNKEQVNIATIEDPIEYGLDGVNQTQINPVAGLTFANGLRSLLRQDPNVIMVGEIRDADTADIAINAAMTGHLVLSTIHTNNALLTIQRLAEMGVPPYLSAPVTRLIVGQRLVRKICRYCVARQPSSPKVIERYQVYLDIAGTFAQLQKYKLLPAAAQLAETSFLVGHGCPKCQDTGYLGRIGIYEVLAVDQEMAHAIMDNPSLDHLRQLAADQQCLSLREDGLLKVFQGLTTFDEVLRVTRN